MFATAWLRHLSIRWLGLPSRRRVRQAAALRRRVRPCLEVLEERLTPSSYTVSDGGDTAGSAQDVTLRYAINQAISNQDQNAIIDFSSTLANKTITLSHTASNSSDGKTAFFISDANITIDASAAPGLVISGGNTLRPFTVNSTGTLKLEDLTLEDGLATGTGAAADGGGVYSSGTLSLSGVTVQSNMAQGGNGVQGNKGASSQTGGPGGAGATANGGGLYVSGGTVSLSNDTLSKNEALGGSGGKGGAGGVNPFGGNMPGGSGGSGGAGFGGGLFASANTQSVTLSNDTLSSNEAVGGSGGVGGGSSSSYGGTGGTGGAGWGGGLFVAASTVTLTSDVLSGNKAVGGVGGAGGNPDIPYSGNGGEGGAGYGGGLAVSASTSTVTLTTAVLSGNKALGGNGGSSGISSNGGNGGDAYGGGVDVNGGSVALTGATFSGNEAVGGNGSGGGAYGAHGGSGGAGFGGGVNVTQGTVTLINDTLGTNEAVGGSGASAVVGSAGGGGAGSGGGVYVTAGAVTLLNDTLSGNEAQGGNSAGGSGGNGTSGGLFIGSGSSTTPTVNLTNTLIALNTTTAGTGGAGGSASDPDVSGNVASSDRDLIGDGSGSNLSSGDKGGDLVGYTAQQLELGALQYNGGPSAGAPGDQQDVQTMALLPGSPAIGAGDSKANGLPSTDERGEARIVGNAIDIGAYQSQGFTLTISGGNNQSTSVNTAFANPLVVTVTAEDDVDPVAGGLLTFTRPSSGASATLNLGNPVTIASNGMASVNATANGIAGSYDVTVDTAGALGSAMFLLTNVGATTITASNAKTTFSTSTQAVKLTAQVSSRAGTVNEGKVTFTVVNGTGKTIGSAASGSVTSKGSVSVNYGLPAYTLTGSYTIDASYTDSKGNFAASSDVKQTPAPTLSVTPAATTTTANNATVTSSTTAQHVTLSAIVTSGAGTVEEGKVKFTVVNGAGKTIGSAASGSVTSKGSASASYGLPAFTNVGSYTIKASYSDSKGNFNPSSNTNQTPTPTLSVTPAATSITATSATVPFSTSSQYVTLTANVTSTVGPVNEGTVTFTLMRGSTVFGTATTSATVSNGQARVSYLLPASLPPTTYLIDASYSDNGGAFAASSNANQSPMPMLTVLGIPTTITTSSVNTTFSTSSQKVTLTAQVSSNGAAVTGGTVTFSLLQGSSIVGTAATSGTVSNGQVSLSYVLPANFAAGSYTIDAVYNPGFPFAASTDSKQRPQPILTVAAAATEITANCATVPSSHDTPTAVTLTAQVQSAAGLVNEGTVTFTILMGNTVIGTATTSATVSNGEASISYVLPANMAVGFYTIEAVYNSGPDFRGSSDLQHMLYVSPAG